MGARSLFSFDVTGEIEVLNDTATVQPGEQAEIRFKLFKPAGIDDGTRFVIRAGGKTVGAGIVTRVVS